MYAGLDLVQASTLSFITASLIFRSFHAICEVIPGICFPPWGVGSRIQNAMNSSVFFSDDCHVHRWECCPWEQSRHDCHDGNKMFLTQLGVAMMTMHQITVRQDEACSGLTDSLLKFDACLAWAPDERPKPGGLHIVTTRYGMVMRAPAASSVWMAFRQTNNTTTIFTVVGMWPEKMLAGSSRGKNKLGHCITQ